MENVALGILVALPLAFGAAAAAWLRGMGRELRRRPGLVPLLGINALLIAVLISSGLLAGEIYYRFVHDTTDAFTLTKVSRRWFARHYHPNSLGIRDSLATYEMKIPEGRQRVTFLGDSFTAGHGVADVERRFANLIRNSQEDWNVHVFNMNGWETGDELLALDRILRAGYELNTVVLVYTLNDLSDLVPEWQANLERIHRNLEPPLAFEHSYFLNMIYFRWQALANPDLRDYYGFVREAYAGEPWRSERLRLQALHQTVIRGGGSLLVVTFPFLHEVGPGYSYGPVHEQLADFWRERGVPHLDLLPSFSAHSPAELVVNRHDPHPNEFAHAVAARTIESFVGRHLSPSAMARVEAGRPAH